MRLLLFQQVALEGPGLLGQFLRDWGIAHDTVAFCQGDTIPTVLEYDALLVLGGPMNVYEVDRYPFLALEMEAIRLAVEQGLGYLGICLGAQLLAKALGAKVEANPVKEIGFSQVQLTQDGRGDALFQRLPHHLPVFQWHGDTFALPTSGVRLATSAACTNQAFRYGNKAYGLQFHLEVTADMVKDWARANLDELLQPGRPVVGEWPQNLRPRAEALRGLAEKLFSNFLNLNS